MSPAPQSAPHPAPQSTPKFAAAEQVLAQAISDRAFPGAAYGVFANGTSTMGALGTFIYESGFPAVQPDTLYDIASVTKVAATTAVAMLLYDQHRLDLNQPIGEVLPEFVASHPTPGPRRAITVHMLLTHTSGLPGWAPLYQRCADRASLLQACFTTPLIHPPLTVAEYSDLGFILLGELLERTLGEPLSAFCTREIFAPLGMTQTRFNPPPPMRQSIPPTENDLAFRRRIIQGEVQDENCWVMDGVSGHAGLFSTVPDLLRFAAAMLNGLLNGMLNSGSQLFSPKSIALFTTRQSVPPGTTRALGWDTPSQTDSSSGRFFSPHSAGHLGYAGTSLWIDFERSIAIVFLANRCWPSRENDKIRAVRPAFHDAVMGALL